MKMKRHIKFDYIQIAIIFVLYMCNRVFKDNFGDTMFGTFMKYHFTDLLFSILLMSCLSILFIFVQKKNSIIFEIGIITLVSIEAEILAPYFIENTTGDYIDILMYFLGIPFYYLLLYTFNFLSRRMR